MNTHGCGEALTWSSAEVTVPCSTWNQYSLNTQLCSACGAPVIGVGAFRQPEKKVSRPTEGFSFLVTFQSQDRKVLGLEWCVLFS